MIAHRLAGEWSPTEAFWRQVVDAASVETDTARPYPFFLAHPLQAAPETLGARDAWLAEWKWDGIRAQLIHRDGATTLWSRGDEPIAGQFPEIMADAQRLPHCVLTFHQPVTTMAAEPDASTVLIAVVDGGVTAWRMPAGEFIRGFAPPPPIAVPGGAGAD